VRHALLDEDVEFDGSDLEREGELAEMRPLLVDPRESMRLWLRAAVTTQDADALWLFDAAAQSLQQVFTLDRQEKLADIAFWGDRVYLAARDSGVSVIYSADVDDLEFEPIATLDATVTCLEVDGERWLACNSDFTRDSPFIVARSEDAGQSWIPELEVEDLGTLTSCGDACAATTGWLYGLYGATNGSPGSGDGRSYDASALLPRSDASDASAAVRNAKPRDSSGCGCRVPGGKSPPAAAWALVLALAGVLRRRISTRGSRSLHCAS
jgi:MYXO-CTERM domain-containing protein